MRNNKIMICTISRKLKRSEQLHFGSKIAASVNLQYEADIVAVAYCAPKTVWKQNGRISPSPPMPQCDPKRLHDVTIRQRMISMIRITTSIPISLFNGWIIAGGGNG
jgi:hypothetical protein